MGRTGHDIPLEFKLRPPAPRARWLERGRLLAMLSAARARFVLVAAPPGFGKTTLAAQWRASLVGTRSCAWVSLDCDDNDPVRLWWHIVCALKQAYPGLDSAGKFRPPMSPAPDLDGTVLPALVHELAPLTAPAVLVLDDYHVIKNRACHDQVAFVLTRLPPQVQVVLVTQADPWLLLARLRTAGEVAEIRARELRFSPEEAVALLKAYGELTLTHRDAATLTRWAGGWPAAIGLAAVALRDDPSPAAFIAGVTRGNRYPVDVLSEKFLSRQTPMARSFLRRTSILQYFTASLCDEVTQLDGSARIIADLERGNPFLLPLDNERLWYAYHPLFASLLRSRLALAEPGVAPALHRRASRWYTDRGSARMAIIHAMSARHTEAVGRTCRPLNGSRPYPPGPGPYPPSQEPASLSGVAHVRTFTARNAS